LRKRINHCHSTIQQTENRGRNKDVRGSKRAGNFKRKQRDLEIKRRGNFKRKRRKVGDKEGEEILKGKEEKLEMKRTGNFQKKRRKVGDKEG
jgi:hypothetical protein